MSERNVDIVEKFLIENCTDDAVIMAWSIVKAKKELKELQSNDVCQYCINKKEECSHSDAACFIGKRVLIL